MYRRSDPGCAYTRQFYINNIYVLFKHARLNRQADDHASTLTTRTRVAGDGLYTTSHGTTPTAHSLALGDGLDIGAASLLGVRTWRASAPNITSLFGPIRSIPQMDDSEYGAPEMVVDGPWVDIRRESPPSESDALSLSPLDGATLVDACI